MVVGVIRKTIPQEKFCFYSSTVRHEFWKVTETVMNPI